MTTGAGFDPFGSSPAGYGEPVTSLALAITGYQRSTTGCVSSVNIDGKTKDFTYDAYGNEEGMSDTAQRVYMLIAEEFGSRQCSPKTGFQRPQTIGANFNNDIEARVKRALAPVLVDGSARFDGVDTSSIGTTGIAYILWTDLRKRVQDRAPAALRQ